MAVKITIPVQFSDTSKSYRELIMNLEAELKKIKPGTAIYDGISNQIKKATKLLEKIDLNVNLGITKQSDIDRLEKDFSNVQSIVERIEETYKGINVKDLNINTANFGDLADKLTEAQKKLASLQEQAKKAKTISVEQLFAGDADKISLFNQNDLSKSGTKIYSNLAGDISKVAVELQNAKDQAVELNTELKKLQAEQTAEGKFIDKRAELIYGITGASNSKVSDMRERLQAQMETYFTTTGKWRAKADRGEAEEVLAAFGLDEATVQNLLAERVPKRLEQIKAVIETITREGGFKAARTQYGQKARISQSQEVIDLQANIDSVTAEIAHNTNRQNDLAAPLDKMQQAFGALKAKLISAGIIGQDDLSLARLDTEIDQVEAEVQELYAAIQRMGPAARQEPPTAEFGELRDIYDAEAEAKQFTDNLKQSIKHWMSAAQVINIIKNGIRQAVSDIQGLDKAMTNIAVVTDMSVGDLWGKINEYMSIAQQYGVTTQGVYEVSQLYYQQGLSTNEVMEATTETLKMARIAGMNYAEAADAMTVAIRAFKMEMSDAQHITDVYSKVAAVTASDTEELAIAMSKTASSAESVGSSFENTTAMLAVMIETTRESAQNLGSALKSIISRYGEMKVGLTVDSEGEEIDYNKVDTALKSVGISLKDTQGQFRDFDDVIFELSEKWDTLDKNTQRYIATIMAGNRQQSRFIALVDNWERLEEVAGSAQDSEDAGLLQYAKTLDSLETKINNIKTSFQEFYMSVLNGPVIGAGLEFVNNLIKGLNKLGNWQSILNIASLITSIKTLGGLIVNKLSSPIGQWVASYKSALNDFVSAAAKSGYEAGKAMQQGLQAGYNNQPLLIQPRALTGGANQKPAFKQNFTSSKAGKITVGLGSAIGLIGSGLGSYLAGNGQEEAGAWLSTFGATGSGAATGAAMGGLPGAIIGGIAGFASSVPALIDALDANTQAENNLAEARKKTEDANIARAEAKQNYNDLKSLFEAYDKADKNRNISEEDYQNWLDINNQLVEAYPTLLGYIDAEGNAIANVTDKAELLSAALANTTNLTEAYYQARKNEIQAEIATNREYNYRKGGTWSHKDAFNDYSSSEYQAGRKNLLEENLGLSGYTEEALKRAQARLERMRSGQEQILENDAALLQVDAETRQDYALLRNLGLIEYNTGKGGILDLSRKAQSQATSVESELLKNADAYLQKINAATIVDTLGYDTILDALQQYNNWVYDKSVDINNNTKALITYLADMGVFSGEAGEIMTLDSHIKAYGENNKLLQELASEERGAHLSKIQSILQTRSGEAVLTPEDEAKEIVEGITGYTSLLYTYLTSAKSMTEDGLNSLEEDDANLQEAITAFSEVQKQLESQSPELVETFLTLYDSLDTISGGGLDQILENLGIAENKELFNTYYQEWYNRHYADMYRQALALEPKLFDDEKNQLESYENYLKIMKVDDSEQAKKNYTNYIKQRIAWIQPSLYEFLYNTSSDIIDNFTTTIANLEKTIDIAGEDTVAGSVAQQQRDLLNNIKNNIQLQTELQDDPALATEFYSLLFQDFGTHKWGDKLTRFLADHGFVDFSTLIETAIFENFSTQVQIFQDSINDTVENWSSLINKQEKGFNYNESQNLLKRIEEATGEEVNWETYFEITSEGLIVLKDFNNAFDTLYANDINKAEALKTAASNAYAAIGGEIDKEGNIVELSETKAAEKIFDEGQESGQAAREKILQDTLKITDEELVSTLAAQEWSTYGDLADAILEYYTTLGYSIDYLEGQKLVISKSAEELNALTKLRKANQLSPTDKAQQVLIKSGLKNLGEQDMATILAAFKDIEYTYDRLTGTYSIDENIIDQIEDIGVRNTLLAADIIDKESLSRTAAESFAELYGNLGEATLENISSLYDSIYGENQFAESGAFEEYRKAIVGEGKKTLTSLLDELKIAAKAEGIEIDESELSAKIADIQQELANDIVSNIEKALKGSLSNIELLELGEKLQLDLGQFTFQTAEGNQLNEEGLLRAAAQLNKLYGAGYNGAKKITEEFAGSNGILGSYEGVTKLIEEVAINTDKWGDSSNDVLKTLQQIQAQYMLMNSDKAFDFMNYDPLQGGADNWKTFTSNVSSAMDVLKSAFEEGNKIDYTQISSIISWLGSQGIEKLGNTTVTLKDFENALIDGMDALGQVDVKAALAGAGLSVGIEDMTASMDDGIDQLADSQVQYWTKYRDFLKGIKKLQEASDGLEIQAPTIDINTEDGVQQYSDYLKQAYEAFISAGFGGESNPIAQMLGEAFKQDWGEINFSEITNLPQIAQQVQQLLTALFSNNYDWVGQAGLIMNSDGSVTWPLTLNTQLATEVESQSNTEEVEGEVEKTQSEVEQYLESLGATKADDNTYLLSQNNLQVKLDIAAGSIDFSFVDSSITPDPEAVNKILQAAGYLVNGAVTFTTADFSATFRPENGVLVGDFTSVTGQSITQDELLAKLGIKKLDDVFYSFTALDGTTFKFSVAPTGNGDLSLANITITPPGMETLFTKLGIVSNGDETYSFTTAEGTTYNFKVVPTGTASFDVVGLDGSEGTDITELFSVLGLTQDIAAGAYVFTDGEKEYAFTARPNGTADFDSNGINTENVSADALLAAIMAKALAVGWTTTNGDQGTKHVYSGEKEQYEYHANGIGYYKVDGIDLKADDLESTIEKSGLTNWTDNKDGTYTYKGKTATFYYNASGQMNIVPTVTDGKTPTMGELLAKNFSEDIYNISENKTGGWTIATKDGAVLFTIPAGLELQPQTDSSLDISKEGVISGLSAEQIVLTVNSDAIAEALSEYEGHQIQVSLNFGSGSESKLVKDYASIATRLEGNFNTKAAVDSAIFLRKDYFNFAEAAKANRGSLTSDDLALIQRVQDSMRELYAESEQTPKGYEVLEEILANASSSVDPLSKLSNIFNTLSAGGLGTNLSAFVELLTSLVSIEAAELDLSDFTTQLEHLGSIELDDEELAITAATAQALADALMPLKGLIVNPSVTVDTDQAESALSRVKIALDNLNSKTITVKVNTIELGRAQYAGNTSGLALAEGHATDKLLAGARLAGKTLVGELGPELAVYNNQYHLLGRDGAEFVNLPANAIVFNHRQTAGILSGQSGYRGKALVEGNIKGPAAASGIDAAIAAVDNIIKIWSNLADATVTDLLGGSGGGGGNDLKAATADMQEWYNLSRQIANLEQEINNLIAERENILDGSKYLRNLRETEKLLNSQKITQAQLLDYQTQQLQRQAEFINSHEIWSKYLYIDEGGLLQYINGNETNGGKGALEILQAFNEMSGKEQQAYLKSIGYTYTDQDGNKLKDTELADKFLEQLQQQIDKYDELYDTVHATEETIEGINSSIKEINEEIKQNQMDLEQAIYDIIVQAWETEIAQMEEQNELIKEANDEYIRGLQEALSSEKQMYSNEQSIQEREALQRRLSLLRRSGGSALEIADLEKSIDDALKDEYFRSQEQMIENIEEANQRQIELLEQQVKLQKDALAYQKENGVLWTQVYEVMSSSYDQILAFLTNGSTDFFKASALEQETMLLDWAKIVGIYDEDRAGKLMTAEAQKHWEEGSVLSNLTKEQQEHFSKLSDKDKKAAQEHYNAAYTSARLEGQNDEEARKIARDSMIERLRVEEDAGIVRQDPHGEGSGSDSGNNNSSFQGYANISVVIKTYNDSSNDAARAGCTASVNTTNLQVGYSTKLNYQAANGWTFVKAETNSSTVTVNGTTVKAVKAGRGTVYAVFKKTSSSTVNRGGFKITQNGQLVYTSGEQYSSQTDAADAADALIASTYQNGRYQLYGFSKGGLVDYTGIAMVHGSKSKPESFLNAEQTAQITQALRETTGKESILQGLHSTMDKLRSLMYNISTINNSNNQSISIAPGAVVIQVEQLADSYDIEDVSRDVMNRMVAIANKATSRGVNRR